MQPVVWQPGKCLYTRYNRLSMYHVYKHSTGSQTRLTTSCIVYTAGCQTGCTTRFDNQLNEEWLFVQHGCQTGCQTSWMFLYTIQPDVNPVWQPVASCKRGITVLPSGDSLWLTCVSCLALHANYQRQASAVVDKLREKPCNKPCLMLTML